MSTDYYTKIVYELTEVTKYVPLLDYIFDILFFFTYPYFVDFLFNKTVTVSPVTCNLKPLRALLEGLDHT